VNTLIIKSTLNEVTTLYQFEILLFN